MSDEPNDISGNDAADDEEMQPLPPLRSLPVDEILKELNSIKNRALRSVQMVRSRKGLEGARSRYLNRRGQLTLIMRDIGALSPEVRPLAGQTANSVKEAILEAIALKEDELKGAEQQNVLAEEAIDITLPGSDWRIGRRHPLTMVSEEIQDIFRSMGFGIAHGPEIESDYNNFEALNLHPHHPARDVHEPFYVDKDTVLRTHTTPVQVRAMMERSAPLAIICPGRVYRSDADLTHSPMFHQIQGLMVEESIGLSDLKGIIEVFIHTMFGASTRYRMRPAYFPFTEPSCQIDVWYQPGGPDSDMEGDWLELVGAGMVHPAVFEAVGYDPTRLNGISFGMSVERVAMIKYGISNIRIFYENDLRFLQQFG